MKLSDGINGYINLSSSCADILKRFEKEEDIKPLKELHDSEKLKYFGWFIQWVEKKFEELGNNDR